MSLTEFDTEALLTLVDSFESFDGDLLSPMALDTLESRAPDHELESSPSVASPIDRASTPPLTDEATTGGQSTLAAASPGRQGKKRRKVNPKYSSTALQRRKRAEIKALREQVAELEARRSLFESMRGTSKLDKHAAETTATRDDDPGIAAHALDEFTARQRADDTNAELKTAVCNQLKVSQALEALVTADSVVEEVNFVFGLDPMPIREVYFDRTAMILAQLRQQAQVDFSSIPRLQDPSVLGLVASTSEYVQQNRNCGVPTTQLKTLTPVNCSVDTAAIALWRSLVTHEAPGKLFKLRRIDTKTIERSFALSIHGPSSGLDVDGFQFVQKHMEPDRAMMCTAGLLVVPESGLRFCVRSWIRVSQVQPASVESAAVVEWCYQIYADVEDDLVPAWSDHSLTRHALVDTFTKNAKVAVQTMQLALTAERGR